MKGERVETFLSWKVTVWNKNWHHYVIFSYYVIWNKIILGKIPLLNKETLFKNSILENVKTKKIKIDEVTLP